MKIGKLIARIKEFVVGVRAELKKVTWTTRKELVASTAVVIITVGIIAVFLGIVDLLMQKGVIGSEFSILQIFGRG